MHRSIRAISALALAMAPAFAIAGPGGTTCASAEHIFIENSTYTGDTSASGYGNPIGGMGPLPSPANDAIYTFIGNNQVGFITVTAAGYNYGIFLTSNCAGTTAPPLQAATGPAVGGFIPINGLTSGAQYYIIMSGNPSDSSAPSGSFTFTNPLLPVELRSFTID